MASGVKLGRSERGERGGKSKGIRRFIRDDAEEEKSFQSDEDAGDQRVRNVSGRPRLERRKR